MRKTRRDAKAIVANEGRSPQRKPALAHWLLLGAGAIGAIGAVARWTANSSRNSSRGKSRQPAIANNSVDQSMDNFLMAPLPQPNASISSAAPSTPVVATADTQMLPMVAPITDVAGTLTPSVSAKIPTAQVTTEALPKSGKKKASSAPRKRGKMSQEFDEALAHNALATDGREGERSSQSNHLNDTGETTVMPSDNSNNSANSASSAAPMQSNGSPAEQALSTQAEGKMAIGEELRDREFPVPAQETGAASQRLVVDQETMHDGGPGPGGAIGAMPGDHQGVGEMADVIDQRAKTPDLVQQQR